MNSLQAINLALKHIGNGAAMGSSTRLCLQDAINQLAQGNAIEAKRHAIHSIRYSVGIFHLDYKRAVEAD